MRKVKVYEYAGCSTCKSALKYLDKKKVSYEKIAIIERPPALSELTQMLAHLKTQGLSFKNLFNTSGVLYREMKISEKLKAGMSEGEALALLAGNGKLIKRPFVLGDKFGTVGFKADAWGQFF